MFFAEVVSNNGTLNYATKSFLHSLKFFRDKISVDSPVNDSFLDGFDKMDEFFKESFLARATGSYLQRFAASNPVLAAGIKRVFTISYGEEGKETVVNLGPLVP